MCVTMTKFGPNVTYVKLILSRLPLDCFYFTRETKTTALLGARSRSLSSCIGQQFRKIIYFCKSNTFDNKKSKQTLNMQDL